MVETYHNHVVLARLCKHTLREVWWEIFFDGELAHDALELVGVR